MQSIGYINTGNHGEIKVLFRDNTKHRRFLKLRTSGKQGTNLIDEGYFLEEHPELVDKLLNGEVITL